MDVGVEEVSTSSIPSWVPRLRRAGRAATKPIEQGLDRVMVAVRAERWEKIVAVGALFVLGRSPVLFFRQHLAGLFHGRAGAVWQDDAVLVVVFATVQLAVIGIGVRRGRPSKLLKQPMLLAVLSLCWLSMMWSIEPAVSLERSLLFAGTAGVGWYIGDRFSPTEQIRLVVSLGAVAAGSTIVALVLWNEQVRSTNGELGQWSGIYVNRNLLGLVLSLGILATVFLLRTTERRVPARILLFVLIVLFVFTRSKTGVIAVAVALTVAACVYWLRKTAGHRLHSAPAAYVAFCTLGTIGLVVHWYWLEILHWLSRDADLSRRTAIWEVDRWFSAQRPWQGYGFEALWTNKRAIAQSLNATHRYPYTSHNGYYEMLLGVGRVGLVVFVGFLALALWRAFHYAWTRTDTASLWPMTFIVFAIVVNFSESLFVSSEAVWALTVAAAVTVTDYAKRQDGHSYALIDRAKRVLTRT